MWLPIKVVAFPTETPGLFVHQAIGLELWTVTHHTGNQLATFGTKNKALGFAAVLKEFGEWSGPVEEMHTRFKPILSQLVELARLSGGKMLVTGK